MIKKLKEKTRAIELRKQGKTYTEILGTVRVAKSTLGLWLKEAKLSKSENQKFTLAKKLASLRGGHAKKRQRIDRQNKILFTAKSDIMAISKRELFLIGVIMYWAEGAKEKADKPGSALEFSNMDSRMILIFLVWLRKVCEIDKNMVIFNIFLHESHMGRAEEVRSYWSKVTGYSVSNFRTIYWKRNKLRNTKRKNIGEKYYGVLKIKVRSSSSLVRKIAGWSEGIFEKIVGK
jgi:hypothetical protein